LPGANAALTALIASGIAPQPFFFYGFLNRQKKEKKKQLEALEKTDRKRSFFMKRLIGLKETLSAMAERYSESGNRIDE
jgi:16S rRNA (cytidine1402-2'-O)-methyltransferase